MTSVRVLVVVGVLFVGRAGGPGVDPNRPTNATCFARQEPPPSGPVRLERVFEHAFPNGKHMKKATQLVQSPADPRRWYLALQDGDVVMFSADPDDDSRVLTLDLSDRIRLETPENGLVSLALHPRLGEEPYAYVVYTAPGDSSERFVARVSRFEVRENGKMDRSSEVVLFEVAQRVQAHSVNHVLFGPDGYLYVSLGEDTASARAQDPFTLYGSILRIDVDAPDATRGTPYSIPGDNPFATSGGAPELYAYGFRNPWRFSFDRETGALMAGDVGQDTYEEIDDVVRGGNYGWPLLEATSCFESDVCDPDSYIAPVVEYTHAEGRSVTGGYRYRGDDIPELQGRYVFADFNFGVVWSSLASHVDDPIRTELEPGFNIPSFAEDAEGELYILRYSTDKDGGIYKLVPNDAEPGDFPQLLSQTGCVDPQNPRAPLPGVVPYRPVAQLWSDGASKERYLAVPDDRRIKVDGDGDFDLPTGSVLIKHFYFEDFIHETRLLMRSGFGWAGYSYEWNEEQTDAVLLESGKLVQLSSGVRWQYPSRAQCLVCHTEVSGRTLGLEAAQLNHSMAYPDDGDANQLEWLRDHGYFFAGVSLTAISGANPSLQDPFGDEPLEYRARSYLHANCAMCHRPGGAITLPFDLRFGTPFEDAGLCDRKPERSLRGFSTPRDEQRLIDPGAPAGSVVYLRMSTRNLFQMPPLASSRPDEDGLALVSAWISSIGRCAAP